MMLLPWLSPRWSRSPAVALSVAVLGVATLTALLLPWRDALDAANIVMLYLLIVVGMALVFTRSAAIVSAVLGVLAFDFFFVSPRLSFSVNDVQYLLTFAVMLLVGVLLASLMASLRRQAEDEARRARQATALYSLARALAGASDAVQVDEHIRRHVAEVFDGDCALWLGSAESGARRVRDSAADMPADIAAVLADGAPRESGTHPCRLFLPLDAPMRRRGVLALSLPHGALSADSRHAADLLASLVATALERLHYVEVAHAATLEMETGRLRGVILAALSHDIRTPLTVMLGLADTLQQAQAQSPEAVRELSGAIHDHATRLNDLAHKLLDMARLQTGALPLRLEWQSVEEILGAALAAMGKRLDHARITLALPEALPLVEFDAVLIERVLCNLFENALRHAGEKVTLHISCTAETDSIVIAVEDDGPGLPADHAQWLFQPFQRGKASAAGGLGLGLAICRAIARAHGGELEAGAADGQGACFSLRLPRRSPPDIEPEE